MNIILLILGIVALTAGAMLLIGVIISGPRYHGPISDHFDGSRFINLGGVKAKGGFEVLRWMISRKPSRWDEDPNEHYGKRPLANFKGGVRVTFVNHATFLVQVDGINVLTDPVWSRRVSPYRWAGPKRKRLPGIRFEDLPRIHLVLLSHNHYDHLDLETMRMVFGAHHPRIVAPLGVRRFLDGHYISGATELDWWHETSVHSITVQSVPAQHFSGRGMLDRDATLWCGYVLKTSAGNIYFCGDTGFNKDIFSEIRSRCGSMKVSMLPIGAYKPGWFMSPIHVSPEEALMIHRLVASQTSIAMHFGTFHLADDSGDDSVNDLKIAMEKLQVDDEEFIVMKEGEVLVFE